MSDFLQLTLDDGTLVLFQSAESDLVREHGGGADVEKVTESLDRMQAIAVAAKEMCQTFRDKLMPDELTLELGIGISGEVGWFFAKSEADASIKITIKWTTTES
jgi:hypothetical protein